MSQTPAEALTVTVAMDTHVGQHRAQNQDAIGQLVPIDPDELAALGQILVLADGVGGLTGGDLASQYAVSTIISSYYELDEGSPSDRLARAIAEANNVIYAEGQEQDPPVIMATTVVAAVIRERDLIVGSVGDSPAFLMRDAESRQLTLDHTVEAMAEHNGVPLPDGEDDAGRKLVRALGSMPSVKVDIITGRVRSGDHVVLCSDGLTRYVTPDEIEDTVVMQPPEQAAQSLIATANERGGSDNISVIVLRLTDPVTDDNLVQLPRIPDPMEGWGRPRSTQRERIPTPGDATESADSPTDPLSEAVVTPSDSSPSRSAPRARPVDNPVRDLWLILRGNTVLTGVGLVVLLVLFAIVMIVIAGLGDDETDPATRTATQSAKQTATATLVIVSTRQAAALQTSDAVQAATAAEIARMTLTPPTPVPTGGPQLESAMWFRVLPGDPIPAFRDPNRESEAATPLEEDENFRVTLVTHDVEFGPWYQVIDNLGVEGRWVSALMMHQRIVVVDVAGNPLPDSEQPLDPPPPDFPTWTPTVYHSPTPLPTLPGTPGTPASPAPTGTATATRPSIPYGVENWSVGDSVVTLDELDLCSVPDVTACDLGQVEVGSTGTISAEAAPSDTHWWWKVEFEDGGEGWIAQVLLSAP